MNLDILHILQLPQLISMYIILENILAGLLNLGYKRPRNEHITNLSQDINSIQSHGRPLVLVGWMIRKDHHQY